MKRKERQRIGSAFMDIGMKMFRYGQDLWNGDIQVEDFEKKVIEPAWRLVEWWSRKKVFEWEKKNVRSKKG